MNSFVSRLFKLPAIFVAGILMTLLLFFFMQALVQVDAGHEQKLFITKILDASVPVFEPELIIQIDKPEPMEQSVTIEIPPETARVDDGFRINIPQAEWSLPAELDNNSTDLIPMSNVMIPLVRSTPNYPNRALSRGIEGFVDLSFTVSPQGTVEDPIVLYAEPEGYFERSALQTIRKWKYAPAMDTGEPQPTFGVRQRIVYEMSDN